MRGYPFGFIGVGTPGAAILSGSGAPSGSFGRDNDFYIDVDVYDIYGPKTAGVWGPATALGGGSGGGLPAGGTIGQLLVKQSSVDGEADWETLETIPAGGTDGQVLRSSSGAAIWDNVSEVPAGGSFGQVLKSGMFGDPVWSSEGLVPEGSIAGAFLRQTGVTPYVLDWTTIREVPGFDELTDQGKVLTINGSNYEWLVVPSPLPTTTNSGWVLTQQSSTPGDIDWSAAPEGIPTYSSPSDDNKFIKLVSGVPAWAAVREVPTYSSPAEDGFFLVATTAGGLGWEAIDNDLPAGGTTRQALVKNSSTVFDVGWETLREVPEAVSPGDNGKFLQASGGTSAWQTINQVPTPASPADDGKVLTANGGDYAWETPSGGGSGLTYRQALSAVRRS